MPAGIFPTQFNSWLPKDIPGCQLWLRSDQGVICNNWSSPVVSWQNLTNVVSSNTGHTLTKSSGGAAWNASANTISSLSGTGAIFWTVPDTTSNQVIGLSTSNNSGGTYTGITFALFMSAGTSKVYENGTETFAGPTYSAGDRFQIRVTGTTVTFYHNGTLIYTSSNAATFPLYGAYAVHETNDTINRIDFGVSQWTDLSGNGNNATQSIGSLFTDTIQLSYNITDITYNNMPSLGALGTGSQALLSAATVAQPCTIIVVGVAPISNINNSFFVKHTGAGFLSLSSTYETGTVTLIDTGTLTSAILANPVCAIAAVCNNTASVLYVNSSTANVVSGTLGTDSLTGITIGNLYSDTAPASIAEVIIYNSVLSVTQISQVFQYLGARYQHKWL